MQAGNGYAESDDRGATWRRSGDGLEHHYLYGLAVDSGDPGTVVISAASSPFAAHSPDNAESYVYRREAAGPWQLAMAGLPSASGMTVPVFAAHAEKAHHFYAASNQGLFRSQDAGRNWEAIPLPADAVAHVSNVRAIAVEG